MQLGPNRSASLFTTSPLPFLPEAAGPLLADSVDMQAPREPGKGKGRVAGPSISYSGTACPAQGLGSGLAEHVERST